VTATPHEGAAVRWLDYGEPGEEPDEHVSLVLWVDGDYVWVEGPGGETLRLHKRSVEPADAPRPRAELGAAARAATWARRQLRAAKDAVARQVRRARRRR
jgi:hypothetical protein